MADSSTYPYCSLGLSTVKRFCSKQQMFVQATAQVNKK